MSLFPTLAVPERKFQVGIIPRQDAGNPDRLNRAFSGTAILLSLRHLLFPHSRLDDLVIDRGKHIFDTLAVRIDVRRMRSERGAREARW
ncbi:hypothetical protein [Cupriavidus necator]|uniref:hypothetical protein n=1 Tax=Cupriavidus necator TaxID=106590 RepID=UPI00339D7EB2